MRVCMLILFAYLGRGVVPVVVRDEDLSEPALSEDVVGDDHVVFGYLGLVELTLPPRAAGLRQRLRPGLIQGLLRQRNERARQTNTQ